jgi:hypothetical protein
VQLLDVFYSSPEKERIVIVWELVQGDDLLEVRAPKSAIAARLRVLMQTRYPFCLRRLSTG